MLIYLENLVMLLQVVSVLGNEVLQTFPSMIYLGGKQLCPMASVNKMMFYKYTKKFGIFN